MKTQSRSCEANVKRKQVAVFQVNGEKVTVEENFREVSTAFERTCR